MGMDTFNPGIQISADNQSETYTVEVLEVIAGTGTPKHLGYLAACPQCARERVNDLDKRGKPHPLETSDEWFNSLRVSELQTTRPRLTTLLSPFEKDNDPDAEGCTNVSPQTPVTINKADGRLENRRDNVLAVGFSIDLTYDENPEPRVVMKGGKMWLSPAPWDTTDATVKAHLRRALYASSLVRFYSKLRRIRGWGNTPFPDVQELRRLTNYL